MFKQFFSFGYKLLETFETFKSVTPKEYKICLEKFKTAKIFLLG